MKNQKTDNALQLSLMVTPGERSLSEELMTGYEEKENLWTVIVKYVGDLKMVEELFSGSEAVPLFNGYGIVRISASQIRELAALPEISYMEKPKKMYYSLDEGRSLSCFNPVQETREGKLNLTGKGVFVAIIDSGIDYRHPSFLTEEGKTRIARLWDQTAVGETGRAVRYQKGREYFAEEINEALEQDRLSGYKIVPVTDSESGHGTAVAGIAAGNGRGSTGNKYRGIATESELLVVKLSKEEDGFSKTTDVMEALDYVLSVALEERKPVAINLSFGNNLGSHTGDTLFETYVASLQGVWKNVICIATGNEGDARHHAVIELQQKDERNTVEFVIGSSEQNVSLQIWKAYYDEISFFLESPDGMRKQLEMETRYTNGNEELDLSGETVRMGGDKLLIYYGEPTPFSVLQEIYIEWIPDKDRSLLEGGRWKVIAIPIKIRDGRVNFWLPTVEAIGLSTGFLTPSTSTTLTIPSTARNIVSVGAYRGENASIASFSGRGFTADNRVAPDIVAPGVSIMTAAVGGGYKMETGTSFAVPFATGSAALLMEWGIVENRDAYLYGDKIKAYFIDGAKTLPGFLVYPNGETGWGSLCLEESIPKK